MGLSSRLEYKNWDFGFSLRASLGNYVYDGINAGWSNMNPGEVWSNSLNYLSNRPVDAVARLANLRNYRQSFGLLGA